METYYGRPVKIYELNVYDEKVWTGHLGRLLEIDAGHGYVIIEDEYGNMVRLSYDLVKLC